LLLDRLSKLLLFWLWQLCDLCLLTKLPLSLRLGGLLYLIWGRLSERMWMLLDRLLVLIKWSLLLHLRLQRLLGLLKLLLHWIHSLLLHRLLLGYTLKHLGGLMLKIWIGPCILELGFPRLQRRMLGLLPSRNIWRWWDIDTRHWISIRWHIRLYALTRQRRWNIHRLLLIRAHHSIRGLRRCW